MTLALYFSVSQLQLLWRNHCLAGIHPLTLPTGGLWILLVDCEGEANWPMEY